MNSHIKTCLAASALVLLSACTHTGSRDISLIPTQTDAITQKKGAFTQPIKWSRQRPHCTGQCPSMKVDSLVFPGQRELTDLVDQHLAAMVSTLDGIHIQPTIADFEEYFWQTADHSDEVQLAAKTIYRNKDLTVLELGAWYYPTGAAHGMASTQFLNWNNSEHRLVSLEDIVRPRRLNQFFELQKQAYHDWVNQSEFAKEDPQQYARLWPFQPTNNVAVTDAGILVKYNPYAIAPYAAGMPQFLIPYAQLEGVLRSEYLPQRP